MPANSRYLSSAKFDQVLSDAADDAAAPQSVEDQADPKKIQFDTLQQEHVNTLIKKAMGRAAAETRERLATAERELAALRAAPKSSDDSTTLELARLRAERDSLANEKQEATVTTALMAAAANQNFVNMQLATRLMRDNVRVDSAGRVIVLDDDGNQRLNSDLDPMTLAEFSTEFAAKHGYLVRSDVRGGAGSVESRGKPPDETLAQLFGPSALPDAAAKLNALSLRDLPRYKRMRDAARAKGLIR